jgi:hypothetical protein
MIKERKIMPWVKQDTHEKDTTKLDFRKRVPGKENNKDFSFKCR